MELYGGFEGGGSSGLLVLLDAKGGVLAEESCDKSCNLLVGFEEAGNTIVDLANKAKAKCGLEPETPLTALGVAMSGADGEDSCRDFETHLLTKHPSLAKKCHICVDTVASIATVFPKGGMVVIAGTGSSALLSNPDGGMHRCGGWGHMMGDEGSAYWISHQCMKAYFDHVDKLALCQHDVTNVQKTIFKYFDVTDRFQMLPHLYGNFSKKFFAGLCKSLAEEHTSSKDALIASIFQQAGFLLARHVIALLPHAQETLLHDGLDVLCIGSVWKSWCLLQEGFVQEFMKGNTAEMVVGEGTSAGGGRRRVARLRLLRALRKSTYGAAYLGGKSAGVCLDIKHERNYEVFFEQAF